MSRVVRPADSEVSHDTETDDDDEYAEALVAYVRDEGYGWDEQLVRRAAPLVQEKIERFGQFPDFAGFLQ